MRILPICMPRRILHKYIPVKDRKMDKECSTHGTNCIKVSFRNLDGRSRQVGGYIARNNANHLRAEGARCEPWPGHQLS